MDDVFVELQAVGHGDEVGELQAQFVLGRGHFVVVLLRLHAQFPHDLEHLPAQVLGGIHRVDREVAALGPGAVAHVAFLIGPAGVGRQFGGIERIAGVMGGGAPPDVVEDEELRLRPEIDRVAHPRGGHMDERLAGHAAGIAVVRLIGVRVQHIAEQRQRGLLVERIDRRRAQIGPQLHVRLIDRLPARDRGTVEHRPIRQERLVRQGHVKRHIAPQLACACP